MAGKDKKSGGGKGKKSGAKTKGDKKTQASAKPAAATRVKSLAKAAASNPVVAEVVAATLVAAAAAIRDPAKARQIAGAAGDELKALTKGTAKGGEAMWQLALDVAGKSIAAFGGSPGENAGSGKDKAAKTAKVSKKSG
jgi:hypothetical protein